MVRDGPQLRPVGRRVGVVAVRRLAGRVRVWVRMRMRVRMRVGMDMVAPALLVQRQEVVCRQALGVGVHVRMVAAGVLVDELEVPREASCEDQPDRAQTRGRPVKGTHDPGEVYPGAKPTFNLHHVVSCTTEGPQMDGR